MPTRVSEKGGHKSIAHTTKSSLSVYGKQMNHHYQTKTIGSLDELIKEFVHLRNKEFWSFRGQRNEQWNLGLHNLPEDGKFSSVCLMQFKKRCMEFSRPDYLDECDDWRWLFYAQHHRLRTRLLDWTTNPLVALYFAVENIISHGNDISDFGAVWALKVRNIDFLTPEHAGSPEIVHRWVMVNPPPVTNRIVRQSGKFSFHPPGDDQLLDLEPRRYDDEKLIKIVIKQKNGRNPCADIRNQLGIMNVHHAALFPDPDGVAKFVNHEWRDIAISFRDELELQQASPTVQLTPGSNAKPIT